MLELKVSFSSHPGEGTCCFSCFPEHGEGVKREYFFNFMKRWLGPEEGERLPVPPRTLIFISLKFVDPGWCPHLAGGILMGIWDENSFLSVFCSPPPSSPPILVIK